MSRNRLMLRAVTVVIIAAGVLAALVQLPDGSTRSGLRLAFAVTVGIYLLTGLLIIERRPGNVVGPIVAAMGLVVAYFLLADSFVVVVPSGRTTNVVAWSVGLLDGVFFFLVAMLFLAFPDGRPPSPRWRVVVVLDLVLLPIVMIGTAIRPGPFAYYPAYQNPIGITDQPVTTIGDVAYVLMIAVVGLCAVSLTGRWRRGDLVERAQIKWVALSAVLIAAVMVMYGAIAGPGGYSEVADGILSIALGVFPVTIAIAILRYHLFEIDRIVSRTLSYLLVTSVLLAAYAVAILVLQGPLSTVTGGETIAVALSTLVAAAAFQPLRRRVQGTVDRRFDRARFDAERTSAAFAERVRDEVDIDAVAADLRGTVATSLRPNGLGLWLREPAR